MLKFLVLVAAAIGIWTVTRWLQAPSAASRVQRQRPPERMGSRWAETATDTVACPRCGDYLPAGSITACARSDCPFPRSKARG